MRCRTAVGAIACVLSMAMLQGVARGQARAPSAVPVDPPLGLSLAYEAHIDRLRYTFENPSNFDTPFLVPHEFTQRYAAGNHWLVASARYQLGSDRFGTEFGVTPSRVTSGSDLDTFHNPENDIILYGTDGDVQIRSIRFGQWSEAHLFGEQWRLGYRYRRDRSQFLPTDRIVRHSNPPSEDRSETFGRETTISQTHDINLEVSKPWFQRRSWHVTASANVSPLIWARLTTILPDKYPGQDIVFEAKALGYGAGIEFSHRRSGWPLTVGLRYGRTWSYADARQFERHSLAIAIAITITKH